MFAGVALALSNVPAELVERHGLQDRIYDRGGEPEVQFLLRARGRVLPVWLGGQLQLCQWGNRRGQSPGLPCTAWTRMLTLEQGGWGDREVTPVIIPATLGMDGGIWFRVREGVRGILVPDEHNHPILYVLVEPASHYYQVMTRSNWMPSLIGELI